MGWSPDCPVFGGWEGVDFALGEPGRRLFRFGLWGDDDYAVVRGCEKIAKLGVWWRSLGDVEGRCGVFDRVSAEG